ncbi:MAG: hypothetical protein AAGD07_08095 [Planctomycetota bacterium]
MTSDESPLDVFGRRLVHLYRELATAGSSDRFSIEERISETKTRIIELGGDPQTYLRADDNHPQDGSQEPSKIRVAPTHLPHTGEYLVGREGERCVLDEAWEDPKTRVVQIVAPGGVGKTQLVKKWREDLLDRDEHGAERVFDWSFYSQGTQQQASADDFLDMALRWFGEQRPEDFKDPWAKGERLTELVRQQRTLLILDGLEPLQHPPGPMEGELADPSLQALLRGLGESNPGLCVVTTRESVPDLAQMREPRRRTIDLTTLGDDDGTELLKLYGVTGSDDELRQASREYGGHALALILLGTFLRDWLEGDITRKGEATLLRGRGRDEVHARNVMAAYVAWFENEPSHKNLTEEDRQVNRAAVSILHLMGLFNRPADEGCLNALRAEPPIENLTDSLFAWDKRDELWKQAVLRLRKARLLADGGPVATAALDAHHLVREHFEEQLEKNDKSSSIEAHRRLYEHLKQSAPDLPDNLSDMMPLYHAVRHGCKAEAIQDSLDEVYFKRMHRSGEAFTTKKLGAFGAEVALMSNFFESRWDRPSSSLNASDRGFVLNVASIALRGIGRVRESEGPMRARVELAQEHGDWRNGAINASNLSQVLLTLGNVSSAVRQGEQGVELADRSEDEFQRLSKRTTLANALHSAGFGIPQRDGVVGGGDGPTSTCSDGRLSLRESSDSNATFAEQKATMAFREAEAMQMDHDPRYPLLYSVQGYQYCDLLLDRVSLGRFRVEENNSEDVTGEADDSEDSQRNDTRSDSDPSLEFTEARARLRELRIRAQHMVREHGNLSFLSNAVHHLALGQTWLLEAELFHSSQGTAPIDAARSISDLLVDAKTHLTKGVALLRKAGTQHHLPRGLLHRAVLWRVTLATGCAASSDSNDLGSASNHLSLAEKDLSEAEKIAERGSMLIYQIEAALERTRLYLTLGSVNSVPLCFKTPEDEDENTQTPSSWLAMAREKLEETKTLIKKTEKPYEPHEPTPEIWEGTDKEWDPPSYVGFIPKGTIIGYHCRNPEIAWLESQLQAQDESVQ